MTEHYAAIVEQFKDALLGIGIMLLIGALGLWLAERFPVPVIATASSNRSTSTFDDDDGGCMMAALPAAIALTVGGFVFAIALHVNGAWYAAIDFPGSLRNSLIAATVVAVGAAWLAARPCPR